MFSKLTRINGRLTLWLTLFFLLAVGLAVNPDVRAESEEIAYRHKVGLIGGVTQENSEFDGSLGLEYEYLFSEFLGIGGLVEVTGGDVERSWLAIIPFYLHPYAEWFFVLAPGAEFEGSEASFLFRAGVGYEFEVRPRWSLVPKFSLDFVSGGDTKLVYALAVVYSF